MTLLITNSLSKHLLAPINRMEETYEVPAKAQLGASKPKVVRTLRKILEAEIQSTYQNQRRSPLLSQSRKQRTPARLLTGQSRFLMLHRRCKSERISVNRISSSKKNRSLKRRSLEQVTFLGRLALSVQLLTMRVLPRNLSP